MLIVYDLHYTACPYIVAACVLIQSTASGFVAMAVMHSEILLVDGLSRQLFSWSCEQGVTIATPHHLTKELGLQGERVVQLASSDIRVTVVTESGKMATFYDRLLQGEY